MTTKIAVIGSGWRAHFFLKLALLMPERFQIVGWVVRSSSEQDFPVKRYQSLSDLIASEAPDYIISAVSWESSPEVLSAAAAAKIPVLSETPPAPDLAGLEKLWQAVGSSHLVQVAEQYPKLPMHAARLAIASAGEIGEVTQVQVSSTHGYHAVALMRAFLNAGFGPVTVQAQAFSAPLVDPLSRAGWNNDLSEQTAGNVLATIDFGDGKSGLYDFTDNQWHNQLRHRKLTVRGSRGEISDLDCIRLVDGPAITSSTLNRYQLGHDLNLDGHDTEHISFDGQVVFRNPFVGLRLMDEEIAIASLMVEMADWVLGSAPAPYPLAQASQDHLVSLAIDESVSTDKPVKTPLMPWGK